MNKFTFTQLGSGQIELLNIENRSQIYIEKDHAKYNWLLENKGRVITISDKGRWNSSVDYKGYYGTVDQKTISAQANAAMATKPIQLTKLDDLNIDESLFVPMSTGTIFDKFVSSEGGFLPGTNIMAAGAPGASVPKRYFMRHCDQNRSIGFRMQKRSFACLKAHHKAS